MISEQACSDKAGLKSNPEAESGQGLKWQNTWLSPGTAAVEFSDRLPELIFSSQEKQGAPVLFFTAFPQDFYNNLIPGCTERMSEPALSRGSQICNRDKTTRMSGLSKVFEGALASHREIIFFLFH